LAFSTSPIIKETLNHFKAMTLKTELLRQGNFLFRYRSYLPIIILIIGVYLYVEKELAGTGLTGYEKTLYELVCFGVAILGLVIRSVTLGYVANRTSGRNTTEGQVADSVNTLGVYSICRHPLYLGNFFMWLGIAAFTQNGWFLVAFIFMYWVYYERIMFAEEEFLTGKFGEEYTSWAEKTPAFIPGFSNYQKPQSGFNFRKVLRQEKTGLLNVFLVIVLLKAIATWFTGNPDITEMHWIFGLAFSLLLYIIVKILQKKTNLLSESLS
jgi:protein-S-isoprenylcysteine O-methyltransferase Ste14